MPIDFNITSDMLNAWASCDERFCHSAYNETVCLYEALKVHANGEMPVDVIERRRPSEPDEIKCYREEIFEPVQSGNIGKVISSLSKIPRSPDWSIKYPSETNARITSSETLQEYCEKNFPIFGSVTNWAFRMALRSYLLDANSVILTVPINWGKQDNEYYKPYPFIFNSPDVVHFQDGVYVVLIECRTINYQVDISNGTVSEMYDGCRIIVVDDTKIYTYETGRNKVIGLIDEQTHGLGELPAFKVPGLFQRHSDGIYVQTSRINPMVPHLNEMSRLYSDLQAELVQHVHSDKWQFANIECGTCQGAKVVQSGDGQCECQTCKGLGWITTSPFSQIVVRPPSVLNSEGTSIPTPPAGYIQKSDVALMVDKIDGQVEKQSYQSLAAINMQFLYQVPLSQSGVAKEVDRDESSNFVYSVAEDVVSIMDRVYYFITLYRNTGIAGKSGAIKLLPRISVPEKYDLLSSSYLMDEIKKAKDAGVSELIVAIMENEYTQKKFHTQPELLQILNLAFRLDPLVGVSDEDKALRLTNNGITQVSYVVSSNIISYIKQAIAENKNFTALPYEEQKKVLETMAQNTINATSMRSQIQSPVEIVEGV